MTTKTAEFQEITQWVQKQLKADKLTGTIHQDLARQEDNWVYMPLNIELTDAFKIADALQKIEDRWKRRVPKSPIRLVLVPTKD